MRTLNFHEIFSLLQNGDEQERVEAKKSFDKLGKSSLETISAFSNEPALGGGFLLLGLERSDKGNPRYSVTGILDPEKLQNELVSACRQAFNIQIRPVIELVSHLDGLVLLVHIPEAEPHDKPVYIKSQGIEKGAFRRIGPTDQHCTKEDLDMLLQLRSRKKYDETVLEGASWKDFSSEAVTAYRKLRKDISLGAKELEWTDEDLLLALGAVEENRGNLRPTVAGLVLFGSEAALRRVFPMESRVDYVIIDGTEWVPKPDKRYQSVEIREALVLAIPRIINLIMRDIPRTFHLEHGKIARRDIPIIPEVVVREAVCNAVMHRDYHEGQVVQILRYANRIDFRNPGFSLKPIDQLGLPGSIARNTRIAMVLHDLNLAETKGSGIQAMCEASIEANLSIPLLESDRATNSFSLTLLTHHLFDERDLEWLANFKDFNLTDDEARTLIVIREMGVINNADYRFLNKMDTLGASGHLRRLRDLGLLEQKGKGNATYYRPTAQLLDPTGRMLTPVQSELVSTFLPSKLGSLPTELESLPSKLGSLPSELESLPSELGSLPSELESLPSELQNELIQLGKRTSPNKMRAAIRGLCSIRAYKAPELAILLHRHHNYLRQTYLVPMVDAEELECVFPLQPTHPQQAYRTKQS